MRCFGEFNNDRLCDLCEKIDKDCFSKCSLQMMKRSRKAKHAQEIRDKCDFYAYTRDSDNYHYPACMKSTVKNGEWARCKPTEECLRVNHPMRCINNSEYEDCLTIGKVYNVHVEELEYGQKMYKLIDDDGYFLQTMINRFEKI